jgi:excisionase family DNA binding protein
LAKIAEAAEFLSVGKTTIYDAIKCGRLPVVRVMTDQRIPWPALLALADTK